MAAPVTATSAFFGSLGGKLTQNPVDSYPDIRSDGLAKIS